MGSELTSNLLSRCANLSLGSVTLTRAYADSTLFIHISMFDLSNCGSSGFLRDWTWAVALALAACMAAVMMHCRVALSIVAAVGGKRNLFSSNGIALAVRGMEVPLSLGADLSAFGRIPMGLMAWECCRWLVRRLRALLLPLMGWRCSGMATRTWGKSKRREKINQDKPVVL